MPPIQTDDARRLSAVIDRLADRVEALGRDAARRDGEVATAMASVAKDLDRVGRAIEQMWSRLNCQQEQISDAEARLRLLEAAKFEAREEQREDRREVLTIGRTQARWGGGIAVALVVVATFVGPLVARLIAAKLIGGAP